MQLVLTKGIYKELQQKSSSPSKKKAVCLRPNCILLGMAEVSCFPGSYCLVELKE